MFIHIFIFCSTHGTRTRIPKTQFPSATENVSHSHSLVLSTVPEPLVLAGIPPWFDPAVSPVEAVEPQPPGPCRRRTGGACDEDDAGARGVLGERQDCGGAGHAAGSAPEVQAAREEDEEVPSPRPRESIPGRRSRPAREDSSHQQDQDLPRRRSSSQERSPSRRRRARDSVGVSAAKLD